MNFSEKINLPTNIKHLIIDCNNEYIIENLPDSLEILEFGCYFNLEINNLPSGIKKIIFDRKSIYDKNLNCMPLFLEYLELPNNYTKKNI